jgi:hypothetical protein
MLVCNWLHSVRQNYFYVMMLIIHGCCFIQSLHFSYELLEDSMQNSKRVDQFPCIHPDAHLLSIIRPDDKNFLFGRPSMSRSFKLFQVASVQTSQQHVRMPFSVRQVKRFISKTQICEDSCNRPDDVMFPFGRQTPRSWMLKP